MRYPANILRVKDGDTFQIARDAGCGITHLMVIRLAGIDCPEKRTEEGKRATDYVIEKIRQASKVEIEPLGLEKYGRTLANVYLDGESLGDLLLTLGLAEKYMASVDDVESDWISVWSDSIPDRIGIEMDVEANKVDVSGERANQSYPTLLWMRLELWDETCVDYVKLVSFPSPLVPGVKIFLFKELDPDEPAYLFWSCSKNPVLVAVFKESAESASMLSYMTDGWTKVRDFDEVYKWNLGESRGS